MGKGAEGVLTSCFILWICVFGDLVICLAQAWCSYYLEDKNESQAWAKQITKSTNQKKQKKPQ